MPLYYQKAIKAGRMEHQDTNLTSMRPRLKELNDNPYISISIVLANVVVKLGPLHKSGKLCENVFVLIHVQSLIWLQRYKFKSVLLQNKP